VSSGWTKFQALLVAAALLLLSLIGDNRTSVVVIAAAGAGALIWLLLNVHYALALGGRGRSGRRAKGDRRASYSSAIALPAPLIFAMLAVGHERLHVAPSALHDSSIRAVAVCAAAIALEIIFLSSLVDWYWIRAWRDGVVVDPPCCRKDREEWVTVTRIWLHHRWIAAGATALAFWGLVGLLWFELAKHFSDTDWIAYLLTLTSPALIPALFMQPWLKALIKAIGMSFSNLHIALGDGVQWTDHGKTIDGIAYDVSIDRGYRVIEQDGGTHYLALAESDNAEVSERRPPAWVCDVACDVVSGADEFRLPRVKKSWRYLIL